MCEQIALTAKRASLKHLSHSAWTFKFVTVAFSLHALSYIGFDFTHQKLPHGGIPRVDDDYDRESNQDGGDQLEEVDGDVVGKLVDGLQRRLVEPDGDEDEAEVD